MLRRVSAFLACSFLSLAGLAACTGAIEPQIWIVVATPGDSQTMADTRKALEIVKEVSPDARVGMLFPPGGAATPVRKNGDGTAESTVTEYLTFLARMEDEDLTKETTRSLWSETAELDGDVLLVASRGISQEITADEVAAFVRAKSTVHVFAEDVNSISSLASVTNGTFFDAADDQDETLAHAVLVALGMQLDTASVPAASHSIRVPSNGGALLALQRGAESPEIVDDGGEFVRDLVTWQVGDRLAVWLNQPGSYTAVGKTRFTVTVVRPGIVTSDDDSGVGLIFWVLGALVAIGLVAGIGWLVRSRAGEKIASSVKSSVVRTYLPDGSNRRDRIAEGEAMVVYDPASRNGGSISEVVPESTPPDGDVVVKLRHADGELELVPYSEVTYNEHPNFRDRAALHLNDVVQYGGIVLTVDSLRADA